MNTLWNMIYATVQTASNIVPIHKDDKDGKNCGGGREEDGDDKRAEQWP